MPHRPDMRWTENGLVSVSAAHLHNDEKPLPEVKASDLIRSTKWGDPLVEALGEENIAAREIAGAHSRVAETFLNFQHRRATRDPKTTQAKHLDNLARDFQRELKKTCSVTDKARLVAENRLKTIDDSFREKIGWNAEHAQELRAVLREMSRQERTAAIDAAIETADSDVLTAALSGHPSAAGITRAEQAAIKARALKRHLPELNREKHLLTQGVEKMRQAVLDLADAEDTLTATELREHYNAESAAARAAEERTNAHAQ